MGFSKFAFIFVAAHLAASTATAATSNDQDSLVSGIQASEGSLEYVVCSVTSTLNVRDESLTKVLFTVRKGDRALPVQSFGTDKIDKTIDGVVYRFMKLQFPDKPANANIGWVAKSYLTLKSQCPGLASEPVAVTPPASSPNLASTWIFPTIKRPVESYKTGMRMFRAMRAGGRLHAAADLYRVKDEPIYSVAEGTVVRDRYYFYEGTYAIEVVHPGGKIVRYGEITGKAAANIAVNKKIKQKQTIGYVGKINSGCCTPMLHFEMYAGTKKGALTQSGNGYNRRSDLMDPTATLEAWEKQTFGTSY